MKKKSIFRMLFLSGVMAIGMNFHHPVTPTLFTSLNLPSYVFGTSFALMCFFSFLTSMFWGELCNKSGRVKVFTISCILYGIAQFMLGYSYNEMSIYVSRAFAGIFAGGATVAAFAYVVDLSDRDSKGKNIAIFTAIQTICLSIGFLIGGFLGTAHYKLAFSSQAVWMIFCGVIGQLILIESYYDKENKNSLLKTLNPFSTFKSSKDVMTKGFAIFLLLIVVTAFATTCYDNAFNYFLKAQLDFKPSYNGIIKAVFGVIGLTSNFTINIWIMKKTNIKKSLTVVLFLCFVASLIVFNISEITIFLFFNVVFFSCNAIYQPIIQAIGVMDREHNEIGIVSGIINALKSLGNVLGALTAGFVYGIYFKLPFLVASIMFLLSFIIAFILIKQNIVEKN